MSFHRLRDPVSSLRPCAPSCAGTRQILLLKLWATVFPVSDKRHPVTTPAALLASSYLSLCPVASLDDVAKGERRLNCS